MKKLVILVLLVAIVIISGCTGNAPYKPDARLTLSESDITLSDNQLSGLIDADIEKFDDKGIPTAFDVVFTSSNPIQLTVWDDGNTQIEKVKTDTLINRGAKDNKQFRILGKNAVGATKVIWTLNVTLLYNGTKIDEKIVSVTVK